MNPFLLKGFFYGWSILPSGTGRKAFEVYINIFISVLLFFCF